MRKTILAALVLLTACNLSPDYTRPDVAVPAQWRAASGVEDDLRDFFARFRNAELERLVAEAVEKNHDMQAAKARLEQARAAVTIAGSGLRPSVDATGGVERTRRNPATGASDVETSLRAGVNLNYELDLFGARRADVAAARATEEATAQNARAVALSVSAETARAYLRALSLKSRLYKARDSRDNAAKVLKIAQDRYEAGAAGKLEVAQQKSALASADSAIAALERDLRQAQNALAVLLARAPQDFEVAETGLARVEMPKIAAGQPSGLLARRPDILAGEAALIAANANIGAARAAFFPRLTIGAGASVSQTVIGDPSATALSIAASLAQTIFSGGALEGALDRAEARKWELVENYRQTVLVSFREAEDAMEQLKAAEKRRQHFAEAASAAREAYDIAQNRYREGAAGLIDFLDAQRSLFSAEDSLIAADFDRLSAAVDLYAALGGAPAEEK